MINTAEINDPFNWYELLEGISYIVFQLLLLVIFFLITKYIKNKQKNDELC